MHSYGGGVLYVSTCNETCENLILMKMLEKNFGLHVAILTAIAEHAYNM